MAMRSVRQHRRSTDPSAPDDSGRQRNAVADDTSICTDLPKDHQSSRLAQVGRVFPIVRDRDNLLHAPRLGHDALVHIAKKLDRLEISWEAQSKGTPLADLH
jgi:hypothetical protein